MQRMYAIVMAMIAALVVFAPSVVQAAPYKWRAVYAAFGATNCGFVTIEQCRATISGIGGFCDPNPFYTGPDKKPTKRTRKHNHD